MMSSFSLAAGNVACTAMMIVGRQCGASAGPDTGSGRGAAQVAQKLAEHGGDVNLMNDHKLTALHMAFMGGHHDCVKLLMER